MKAFSDLELSSFCGQMALILKSGISSAEGLALMLQEAAPGDEKAVLESLLSNMQETGSLCRAMESAGLFPSYLLHMTEIGEETGTLDEVMEALQNHYDREDSIRKSIRSSVTYPMIMTGMMALVVVILLVKVMPVFNQVFIQLGTEMTGFSRLLLHMGGALSRYSAVFILLLVLIAGVILYGTRTRSGRKLFYSLGGRLPFTRSIYEELSSCRFAGAMGLMLKSGLNPERSMELAASLNEDPAFQRKLEACTKQMEDGAELSAALTDSGIFTGLYARMISIGSRTGSMDQVMEQLADLYQENIDTRMNNLLAVLEPTLVILLSLIVGVILLSVMLPLMGIMSGI